MMLQTHGINPGRLNVETPQGDIDGDQRGGEGRGPSAGRPTSQGNAFAKKKENLEDKQKILELIQKLEENNQQIFIHKLEIRSLKDQVIKLLEEGHFQQFGEQEDQPDVFAQNQFQAGKLNVNTQRQGGNDESTKFADKSANEFVSNQDPAGA